MKSEKSPLRKKPLILFILSGTLIILTVWFFCRELFTHWEYVRHTGLHGNPLLILSGSLLLVGAHLCYTRAWHCAIRSIPGSENLPFGESIAIVNITLLTKYLPGAIWSYALQMAQMKKRGVPPEKVLHTNLQITFLSILINIVFSVTALYLGGNAFSAAHYGPLIFGVVICYVLFFLVHKRVVSGSNRLFRFFNKNIEFHNFTSRELLTIQGPLVAMNMLFGFSGVVLCYGAGFHITANQIPLLFGSLLLADFLGFITLVAPAGVGIRESAMYLFLSTSFDKGTALLIPLVLRSFSILVDGVLGSVAYLVLRKYRAKRKNESGDFSRAEQETSA